MGVGEGVAGSNVLSLRQRDVEVPAVHFPCSFSSLETHFC